VGNDPILSRDGGVPDTPFCVPVAVSKGPGTNNRRAAQRDFQDPAMSSLEQPAPSPSPTVLPLQAGVIVARPRPLWVNLVRLARPHQWSKGAFVVVGPVYAIATAGEQGFRMGWGAALGVLGAVLAFGFASSSCYILNDIRDREADRAHPRKRYRPIASGAVTIKTAAWWGVILLIAAGLSTLLALIGPQAADGSRNPVTAASWLGIAVAVYILNTTLYTLYFKHAVVLDVISLATGFVLRVLGGCAAAGVMPSAWLLNCTFFVSMFLAFGKRLGERRSMGDGAAATRQVHLGYTQELLRMAVVVTGVVCLVTYAGYVQSQGSRYEIGFNLLWLTMLPATYGLLRCIVLLERGAYDDPTELASKDRPFQVAVAAFVGITLAVMLGMPGSPM
jgi:decaprenyl-phosphate phosphoribosyltransferase